MNGKMFLDALKGMAAGILAAIIIMLIFNLIALKGDDPDKPLTVFAYISEAAGAAVCGIVSAKIRREQGMAVGALSGAMYACILLLGALIPKGDFRFLSAVIMSIVSVAIAGLCGVIGLPVEKSAKARRRDMNARLWKK